MAIFLLTLIALTNRCNKENRNEFNLIIENNYFESVDSVALNHLTICKILNPSEVYPYDRVLLRGRHSLSFYTKSSLIITGILNLEGNRQIVRVGLSSNGSISYLE